MGISSMPTPRQDLRTVLVSIIYFRVPLLHFSHVLCIVLIRNSVFTSGQMRSDQKFHILNIPTLVLLVILPFDQHQLFEWKLEMNLH
jgi:hypothetical protein